jgi:hypothetical protein
MGNGAGKISEHDAEKIAGKLFSHAKFDAIKNPTDGMVLDLMLLLECSMKG